jgi:thymidylate kinase
MKSSNNIQLPDTLKGIKMLAKKEPNDQSLGEAIRRIVLPTEPLQPSEFINEYDHEFDDETMD